MNREKDFLTSTCMYYRHDFGLLNKEEQEKTILQAKGWIYAAAST